MKIVHLLPELNLGGVERHVIDLANTQANQGHDVAVCSAGGRLEGELLPSIVRLHLPIHRKNLPLGLWCAARLVRWSRRDGWQLFHAHSRVPAWVAYFASAWSGLPWVVTAHATYSHNLGLWPYSRADGAICVSQAVMDWLKYQLPTQRIVIPNGLNLTTDERWRPKEESPDQPVKLLFVGRLTPIKGLGVLLKALAELTDLNWQLSVAGEGDNRDDFVRLMKDLGLTERVSFLGYRSDVERLLLDCDLFVAPSRAEGMGLVLVTAAKLGVPAVASNIPAIRELCLSDDGLLAPCDIGAWSRALRLCLGRAGVTIRFDERKLTTVAQMTQKVEAFYRVVLDGEMIQCRS